MKRLYSTLQTIRNEFFIKSWWVWVCFIICFALYEQGNYILSREIQELESEIQLSSKKLLIATTRQQELKLQLGSLSDPAWIELELIQNLGVVPDGYTKIYFQNETPKL